MARRNRKLEVKIKDMTPEQHREYMREWRASRKGKRRRFRFLTDEERIDIINLLEDGRSIMCVAGATKRSYTTVYKIKQQYKL